MVFFFNLKSFIFLFSDDGFKNIKVEKNVTVKMMGPISYPSSLYMHPLIQNLKTTKQDVWLYQGTLPLVSK